ncbi:MAG: cytochrome C assembly family protein [Burkholderiaceae bacterium]
MASLAYLMLGARSLRPSLDPGSDRRFFQWLLLAGLCLHGLTLLPAWFGHQDITFGFAVALSWMAWLTLVLLWTESWSHRMARVGLWVYLIAAALVLLPLAFPGGVRLADPGALFRSHILVAMLAYSAFAVASGQALLMLAQSRALHRPSRSTQWLVDLPPLLAMDASLSRSVGLGFALLSATLLTGGLVNDLAGVPWLKSDHKTVFTVMTWLSAGLFLWGRWRWGWRGRLAARFAIGGFGLLLLAYVGSRFVLEVFLGRVA